MKKLQGSALLKHVIELSSKMAATRELSPLLSYAIHEVLNLVGAERGFIVLLMPNGELEYKVKRRHDGSDIEHAADEISHSILSEVVSTGHSLVVANAMTDSRFASAVSVMHNRIRSVICVPLTTQNKIIGAIYVENRSVRGRFSEKDRVPLELFSNQAAISIENASLNENLAKANEELRALYLMKSNLVMLVAHELRTPITSLNGYMQMLKLDSQPMIIENLEHSVKRVVNTINEIIISFRIISEKLEIDPTLEKLEPIVQQVIEEFNDVCTERKLNVTVSGLHELPNLMIDRDKIYVVLSNVIGNSVKYTPDGGNIWIQSRQVDDFIEITIQDSGIGVPAEEQTRIFDLFHVLGSIDTHSTSKNAFKGGGLGLGLPIARGIVKAHGGTICLESEGYNPEDPPGTSCIITLPIKHEHNLST